MAEIICSNFLSCENVLVCYVCEMLVELNIDFLSCMLLEFHRMVSLFKFLIQSAFFSKLTGRKWQGNPGWYWMPRGGGCEAPRWVLQSQHSSGRADGNELCKKALQQPPCETTSTRLYCSPGSQIVLHCDRCALCCTWINEPSWNRKQSTVKFEQLCSAGWAGLAQSQKE